MNENPNDGSDDWLLPNDADQRASEPAAAEQPSRRRRLIRSAALVLGGLIVGGGAVATVQAVADDGREGFAPPGAPGGVPGGPGGVPGGPGGVAGEQHLQGTLTDVTSSTVTVKTSDGTETYTLLDDTQILRNGQPATVDALEVDDPVLVHVYPSSSGSDLVVERLFAGTLPTYGETAPDDDSDDSTDGSSDEDTSAT